VSDCPVVLVELCAATDGCGARECREDLSGVTDAQMQELRKAIKLREDVRCLVLAFVERAFECLFLNNILQEAAELKQLVRIRYCCASICVLIACIMFRSLFTLRQQQQAARESIQKAQEQKAAVSVPCFHISLAPCILFLELCVYIRHDNLELAAQL